jgi:sigma-B regulation protein RsbU (phosphoserine phosphatase)
VLGIQAEWTCVTAEVVLDPGDTLVVYTDGATEAMSPALELFGEQRLAGLLAGLRRRPLQDLLEAVAEAVQRFGCGVIADDLTLVAVRPRMQGVAGPRSEGSRQDTAVRAGRRERHADLHPSR